MLENLNPTIYAVNKDQEAEDADFLNFDEDKVDLITPNEIYQLIRNINDPEHPLTLEQLNVVNLDHITVTNTPRNNQSSINSLKSYKTKILVKFTPTIPHCSMATLIGLCIRVKLQRFLSKRIKVRVEIREGTHQSEKEINKQLNDKERVYAAVENKHLLRVVNQCLNND